jgi:pimeloyl-ACP methyl ester carboxylesterase
VLGRAVLHGRRAIAVDLPGCGRSRRHARDLSAGSVARVLSALLDALRLPRVDVVGRGWGGLVGRALTSAEPEIVRSLLVIDAEGPSASGAVPARRRSCERDATAQGDEEIRPDPLSDPDHLWRRIAELAGAIRGAR